jgi:hypothetical protein
MQGTGSDLFKTMFLLTPSTKQKTRRIVKKNFILGKICVPRDEARLLSSMKFFTRQRTAETAAGLEAGP